MRFAGLSAIVMIAVMSVTPPAMAQQTQQQSPDQAVELPRLYAVRATVADLARSEAFYRDGLGATQVRRIHEHEIMVQFPTGPGVILAQTEASAAAAPVDGAAGFILQVADIDAATARAQAAGARIISPPNSGAGATSFGVRAAFLRDPDGVGIELIQLPQR